MARKINRSDACKERRRRGVHDVAIWKEKLDSWGNKDGDGDIQVPAGSDVLNVSVQVLPSLLITRKPVELRPKAGSIQHSAIECRDRIYTDLLLRPNEHIRQGRRPDGIVVKYHVRDRNPLLLAYNAHSQKQRTRLEDKHTAPPVFKACHRAGISVRVLRCAYIVRGVVVPGVDRGRAVVEAEHEDGAQHVRVVWGEIVERVGGRAAFLAVCQCS